MIRNFYFHPDRQKEVNNALLDGSLVASQEQLIANEFMPLTDNDGKHVMGWWVDEFSPEDFFSTPKVPDEAFAYLRDLSRLAESLSGALPMRRPGIGPHREDYATQEAFDKARGGPVAIEDTL